MNEESNMKHMTIALSRYGINITYKCFKGPGYGKDCPDRDDGSHCMKCKFTKAEMSGYDATRLLESFGSKMREDRDR